MCETDPIQPWYDGPTGKGKQMILAPDGFARYGFIRFEEIIR